MHTFDSIQELLEDQPKIKTGKAKSNFPTLKSLLDFVLTKDKTTGKMPATFYVGPGKEIQCQPVHYGRSFSDLFNICRYVFPKVTLKEILMYFKENTKNFSTTEYFIQNCKSTTQTVVRKQKVYPFKGKLIHFCIDGKKYKLNWKEEEDQKQ